MRYSVWNPGTAMFDYFDDATAATSANAPAPGHLKTRTLGSTVEQAAYPLPADAVPAGSGAHAEGRVAIARDAALAGDGGGNMSIVKGVLLAISGAVAVKVLFPKRRR